MNLNLEAQVLTDLPSNFIPETSRRCKILVVGDGNIGKSAFIKRIEFGKFDEKKSEEKLYRVISRNVNGQTFTVELVEKDLKEFTEENSGIKSSEMRDVDSLILCYAINNLESFHHIKDQLIHVHGKIPPNANITLIGTKADAKEMQVLWEDVDSFAEVQGFSSFETSSKSGVNVEAVIQDILDVIYEKRFSTQDDEVMSDQPIYGSTVSSSHQEDQPSISANCWIPNIPICSFFRNK